MPLRSQACQYPRDRFAVSYQPLGRSLKYSNPTHQKISRDNRIGQHSARQLIGKNILECQLSTESHKTRKQPQGMHDVYSICEAHANRKTFIPQNIPFIEIILHSGFIAITKFQIISSLTFCMRTIYNVYCEFRNDYKRIKYRFKANPRS